MSRFATAEHLEEVTVDVEIDDTSAITVATSDRGADLRVQTPGVTPLSAGETHLLLAVSGEETSVEIELDGVQVEALADAIEDVQEGPEGSA